MTVDFKKYTDFVDEVTSQASKDAEYFVESCEIGAHRELIKCTTLKENA